MRGWKIVDRETGKRATVVTFFAPEQAEMQIESWYWRQERGGRPDVTVEMLDRMMIVPEDGAE